MSFNATVLPSLNIEEEIFTTTTLDQKIFAGNKLITNASPLIYLVLKLKNKLMPKDINDLKKKLIQEVKIFEDIISNYNYNAETILKARYGLCAFIDDLLAQTTWGIDHKWEHNGLLYAFDKEISASVGKNFFSVLQDMISDAVNNIDILELYYMFLTLGFCGKYRGLPKSKPVLVKFTNDLYNCISSYRVHFDNSLFQEEIPVVQETISEKIKKIDYKYFGIAAFSGFLIFLFFFKSWSE